MNNYEIVSNDRDITHPTKPQKINHTRCSEISAEKRLESIEKKTDILTSEVNKTQIILQEEINSSAASIQDYQRTLTSHIQKEIRHIQTEKKQALSDFLKYDKQDQQGKAAFNESILKCLTELNKSVLEIVNLFAYRETVHRGDTVMGFYLIER
jgi:hypothetical protein